jgi:hypothetical protein
VSRSEWAGYVAWPKFDLEMKFKVKYWTWNFLNVLLWSIMRNMRFIVTNFFKLQTFKVWNQQISLYLTLKFRSNINRFSNSLANSSYTLSILFSAIKPIVKKLLSIKIVIFHICTLSSIIRKLSVTGSCLEQTWERTS